MKKQLVVIGGGAAGFFCAITAARLNPALAVTIVEKTGKLLSKVKVSGGGRCNVTHALFDLTEMSKRYPRGQNFVRKAFHQFSSTDTVAWFEERGVALKAEKDGRMFPTTDSSQTIVDCLMREAHRYNVEIRIHTEINSITRNDDGLHLQGPGGLSLRADWLCIACGGYPKTSMFAWLQSLGHTVAEPVPSLFTFNLPKHPVTALMGVSVERARVKIEGSKLSEEGPVLITHWGLSGPAILRLSAWGARELASAQYNFKVHINWLPDKNDQSLKELMTECRRSHAVKKIGNYNIGLPARLWLYLLQESGIDPDLRFADLPAKLENALIRRVVDEVFEVKGKTTFKEEFVKAGGIQLGEVDVQTMQSRKMPGVFFAGEILDVDGITGGFNFQHAWTSGYIAAKSISEEK